MGKSERNMNNCLLTILRFGESGAAITVWAGENLSDKGPMMKTSEIITAAEIGALTVIDLRDLTELQSSGYASGAIHIPLRDLIAKADPSSAQHDKRISLTKPIAVYSAAGRRAKIAVQLLNGFGYNAQDIGGFYVWAAAGGPVTRAV
jgi:rhodanese-related sulfurtransferase